MVSSADDMDEISKNFFIKIQDVYPGLDIDITDYDQHLAPLCSAIYKFFVKNAAKLMYVFIREFIYNNKNRKVLVGEYSNVKMPNYPKEQYGKKEYYILITKLNAIVDEIFADDDIKLDKFIDYIERSGRSPVYLEQVKDALDQGLITDKGVISDMYKQYKDSDHYRGDMNHLEMDITTTFILPYLEENGMMSVRIPMVEDPEELDADDTEEEDEEET
jgi:hypothetical protein